ASARRHRDCRLHPEHPQLQPQTPPQQVTHLRWASDISIRALVFLSTEGPAVVVYEQARQRRTNLFDPASACLPVRVLSSSNIVEQSAPMWGRYGTAMFRRPNWGSGRECTLTGVRRATAQGGWACAALGAPPTAAAVDSGRAGRASLPRQPRSEAAACTLVWRLEAIRI